MLSSAFSCHSCFLRSDSRKAAITSSRVRFLNATDSIINVCFVVYQTAKIQKFLQNEIKIEKNVKISTERNDPRCSPRSLDYVLRKRCPMSSANDVRCLLPMSSSPSCPSSRTTVFRVFRVLMPLSSESSCSSSLCSNARHHFALTLVITLLSGSCLLGRCFLRVSYRVFMQPF